MNKKYLRVILALVPIMLIAQEMMIVRERVQLRLVRPTGASAVSDMNPEDYYGSHVVNENNNTIDKIDLEWPKGERRIKISLDEIADPNAHHDQSNANEKKAHPARNKIAEAAKYFYQNKVKHYKIGRRTLRIDQDCSHFVRAVYHRASNGHIDLFREAIRSKTVSANIRGGVRLLATYFKKKHRYAKIPQIGDIIIFHNTYDVNRNQRYDDYYTHTGIITGKRSDGTYTFIHGNAGRYIKSGYINLDYPSKYKKKGKIINTFVRVRYKWMKKTDPVMSAQLATRFGGF